MRVRTKTPKRTIILWFGHGNRNGRTDRSKVCLPMGISNASERTPFHFHRTVNTPLHFFACSLPPQPLRLGCGGVPKRSCWSAGCIRPEPADGAWSARRASGVDFTALLCYSEGTDANGRIPISERFYTQKPVIFPVRA